MSRSRDKIRISFHGRILDHLGIQMYQSPVAAVAELISNTWDADAEEVYITLPDSLDGDACITIRDNGSGMTFDDCEYKYLNIGWCRRGNDPRARTDEKERPTLGRKGIGKFAGFGVASTIRVDTVSKSTGERTVFEMNIDSLRGTSYVTEEDAELDVIVYEPPNSSRRAQHGTTITLKDLTMERRPSRDVFLRSMSRRFLLHHRVDDFAVFINETPLPKDADAKDVQYDFPTDYPPEKEPDGITIENQWAIERLPNGHSIRWRVVFYKETIDEEELRGVAVFANGKLAQVPFFFNLTGGLGGQHGQAYLSGKVEADFVDELPQDLIAPERQRIDWNRSETVDLLEWGRKRVKELLVIWKWLRGEDRRIQIESKLAVFAARLDKLPTHERRTVKRALTALGGIPTISDSQFAELAASILTAWEQGRLHELIDEISTREDPTGEWFLEILVESDALAALNVAEVIRTKLETIRALEKLVDERTIENDVRDYIAERPYLLNQKWETFRKETSLAHILDDAAKVAKLDQDDEHGRKRVDLALKSQDHLLVVEFMRPGKKLDWDHLARCKLYVQKIRARTKAETELGIDRVSGLIVADELDDDSAFLLEIMELAENDISAFSWPSLISLARRDWEQYMDVIRERAPEDERVLALAGAGIGGDVAEEVPALPS